MPTTVYDETSDGHDKLIQRIERILPDPPAEWGTKEASLGNRIAP